MDESESEEPDDYAMSDVDNAGISRNTRGR